MSENKFEEFRGLFDSVGQSVDLNAVDEAIMSEDAFETLPVDENAEKFKHNLKNIKEDIDHGKQLERPEETKTTEEVVAPKETDIAESIAKAVADVNDDGQLDMASEEKNESPIKEDEETADNNNKVEDLENGNNTDSEESGEKAMEQSSTNNSKITALPDSDHFNWNFKSPSPKFDKFYMEKNNLVFHITGGEYLPFKKFRDDLKRAKVDLSHSQFDRKTLSQKMTEVQKWRDRIQEISIQTNRQYYLWHRFVELLHGYLASVAYEKPVDKFKGVIYRHMRDVESYYANLESLKDDIEAVTKNLDSVFHLLSRQLTLMLNPNEVPVVYNKEASKEQFGSENFRTSKQELASEFDSLKDSKNKGNAEPNQQEKKKRPKSGMVDWDFDF